MGKKMTAFALAALLVLGLSGCGSSNNVTTDRYGGSRSTYGSGNAYNGGANGSYGSGQSGSANGGDRNRGIMGNIGDGIDNAMDDAGDAIRNAGDALTGSRDRYREMLENGRVHDSDGYLLDDENRHD